MNIYLIIIKNTVTKQFVTKPVAQFFTARQAFGTLKYQFPKLHGFHTDYCDYYGVPQLQPLEYVVTKRQFDAEDVQVFGLSRLPATFRSPEPWDRPVKQFETCDDLPF